MLPGRPWKTPANVRLLAVVWFCVASLALTDKPAAAEDSLLNLVVSSLALHGPILLGVAFFLKSSGITWNQAFGFSQPPVGRAIIFGVFAALVFLPVGMFLQAVSIKVLTSWHVAAPPQAAVEEFNKNAAIINRVYLAFFAIAIAPIVEEILFRGVLYASLKMIFRKLGENLRSPLSTESGWRTTFREALVASLPWLAMPLSALAFAAIHLSAQIFLPIFVLGLLLAWLYEKTGNLLAPVTAHTLFNAINVALLLYGDNLEHLAHPSVTAPQ